ncbi:MAG: SIS domain-containing protein [Candidatus Izemoplasmatales bacterium]
MKTRMELEIEETPDRLRRAFAAYRAALAPAAAEVRRRGVRAVVFAGRGSSDNAGVYFKYLIETRAGLPVAFAAPSATTLYGREPDFADKLVVGASQSGQAEDVAAVLSAATRQGAVTIALTNVPGSPVARAAGYAVDLAVGVEESVAATKTFTAELLALGILTAILADDHVLEEELATAPALFARTLAQTAPIDAFAQGLADMRSCFVLARGYHLAIAHELALKLQESCYVLAHSYSLPDFRHGPFALAEKDAVFILLAPSGVTMPDADAMLRDLRALGARVLVFTDDPGFCLDDRVLLPRAPETVAPFALAAAVQLFACRLSAARRQNPDAPRGLKKVTVTK